MKLIATALSCALSISAFAESPQPNNKYAMCVTQGQLFMNAAHDRDTGMTPQDSFKYANYWSGTGEFSVSTAFIKRAINLVYFDPGFVNAGGNALASQIEGDCLRDGKPQFQPLK